MSRRTRTIVGIGLIELLLAGLWFWLAQHAAQNPDRVAPDAQVVIGQTMGAVMGAIAGLAIPLYLFARKNDLKG
jgi:hypothetical protein